MSIVVNTNTQSIFAQRALRNNTRMMERNIERLSTGYRINRAADDAAGLSIANKLTTTIRGLEKAKQNAADGISLLQTAEGGLQVIQDNLQRIRELVVQGVSGTNGTKEKDALQREINERVSTIDAIAKATKFNGNSLLTGTSNYTLQTGADDGQTTTISFASNGGTDDVGIDIDITETQGGSDDEGHMIEGIGSGLSLDRLQISGATINSQGYSSHSTNSAATVGDIDTMIDNISRMRSYIGAMQNSLESQMEYMDIALENNQASRSRIQDVDVAKESSVLVKNQILQQSAAAMLSQANSTPQIALNLIGR